MEGKEFGFILSHRPSLLGKDKRMRPFRIIYKRVMAYLPTVRQAAFRNKTGNKEMISDWD